MCAVGSSRVPILCTLSHSTKTRNCKSWGASLSEKRARGPFEARFLRQTRRARSRLLAHPSTSNAETFPMYQPREQQNSRCSLLTRTCRERRREHYFDRQHPIKRCCLIGIVIESISLLSTGLIAQDPSHLIARDLSSQNTVSTNQLLTPRKALQATQRARSQLIAGRVDQAQKESHVRLISPHVVPWLLTSRAQFISRRETLRVRLRSFTKQSKLIRHWVLRNLASPCH